MILLYASTYEIERAHNPLTQVDLIVHAAILGRDPNKIFDLHYIMCLDLKKIINSFVDAEKIVETYPDLSDDKKELFKKYARVTKSKSWYLVNGGWDLKENIVLICFPVKILFEKCMRGMEIDCLKKNLELQSKEITIQPEIDKTTTFETLRGSKKQAQAQAQALDSVMKKHVNSNALWDDVQKGYYLNGVKIELDDAIQELLNVLKKDNLSVKIDPVVKF